MLEFDVLHASCGHNDAHGFFIEERGMKSLPICGVRRNYRSIVSSGNKITLTFYAPKEVPLCFVNLIIHDRINVFDEHRFDVNVPRLAKLTSLESFWAKLNESGPRATAIYDTCVCTKHACGSV